MTNPRIETPAWIDPKTFRLSEACYWSQRVPKSLIVLHATASASARSVFEAWKSPSSGRVATAYVVERDGRIFEMFPPDCWAYHLGMKDRNPGHYNDRRSIGIEIVNPGPLRPDPDGGDSLNWWPKNFREPWCRLSEPEKFVRRDYRGYGYWAAFTPEQEEAVRRLTEHLCRRFGIPRVLPPVSKRMMCDPDFFCRFAGIAAHQNFRADKLDVGPAWNWDSLLDAAQPGAKAA
ncbi:MAG: N-acetylmuramoyl-L-alanine amidase [Bryobacteraceae bacterium]|nr:N-acetylmuramoyl-L-alanine amidase [Bryobacteraceae bacterium]